MRHGTWKAAGLSAIEELIPHIDGHYRTDATRESRMISGFSMGGNMAFYYAVKHPELFGAVTAYAGTYHHLYNKEYRTVGVAPEKAVELYEEMMSNAERHTPFRVLMNLILLQ